MTAREVESVLSDTKLSIKVNFLDQSQVTLEYDIATTIEEAIEHVADKINLKNYSTFTLYEILSNNPDVNSDDIAVPEDELHVILDDNRYLVDIIANSVDRGIDECKLLFKKKMFREQDEHINELTFINLSYVQAQHDYLLGNYPVPRSDAAQLCALQIFITHVTGLEERDEVFKMAVETFIYKRALMSRPRIDWIREVYRRYAVMNKLTIDIAKLQFLRILRSLPYGNLSYNR